ncbi:MAG: SusD/RagB family nutrient-binding outer membrane lipoprotein [Cyclobacteriaceae bacterium]|nr:SusD/RagB family nutrient-binding outer membrane lipoprotein [Cyclobacteriaceae bacterium]
MKKIKSYILALMVLLVAASCDKDFVEVNTNPYAVTSSDPALLFAGAQRTHLGNWNSEHTIVQQFVSPFNDGATIGVNFNADIDLNNNPKWNESYPTAVRNLVQALNILGATTDRVNLKSMIRIWKAQAFMGLVDTYGDVPYFDAGKAVSNGIFFPAYDDDAVIYDDLYKELKEAIAALNPAGDFVAADLFYGSNSNASTKTTTAAEQVAKWKKLGNSLLLRLGMRYTKINASKAQAIVAEAFSGGVMSSNADNAYVKYDGSTYVHAENNGLRNFSQFNYAAEPFVNQLKSTNDPRARYMIATYFNAGQVANDPNPNTNLADQYGVPIGVTSGQITSDLTLYRGSNPNGGLAYSQINIYAVGSPAAPDFYVTFAQTSLLLAEAAKRGWIPGGDATAQTHYENAIEADMLAYSLYPTTTPISASAIAAYKSEPGVAYNAANALSLINTQYWIVNFRNGTEAFANFRRTGLPALSPNLFNNNLGGGFVRRLTYPDLEGSANNANFEAASTAIGGDNLTTRVFWDN